MVVTKGLVTKKMLMLWWQMKKGPVCKFKVRSNLPGLEGEHLQPLFRAESKISVQASLIAQKPWTTGDIAVQVPDTDTGGDS